MTAPEALLKTLLQQRHAHFIGDAFGALLMAWRSHFELAPQAAAERKGILVALGTLGEGHTPRDRERIAGLPAALLEPTQLEDISREIEAIHADIEATLSTSGKQG